MANFPINPGISSIFTDTTSGFRYKWTGTVWKSFTPSAGNDVRKLDDISSSFNNSTTTFALAFTGTAVTPVNAQSLTVSLGGVVQEPGTDYTVSGSNITFTTAPNSGLDFFAINRATATDIITKTGVLDNLIVSGMSTQSSIQATSLNVSTGATFGTGINVVGGGLTVTGISTFNGNISVLTGNITLGTYNSGAQVIADQIISGAGAGSVGAQINKGVYNTRVDDDSGVEQNAFNIGNFNDLNSMQIGGRGTITTKGGIVGVALSITGIATCTTAIVGSAVSISAGALDGGRTVRILGENLNVLGIATAQDFDSLSDINFKENISTVHNALETVEQLRGVSFNWKESGEPSYGVIAQEMENVLPELVHGDDPKRVNYNGIIGVLIEAVKELSAEVKQLKTQDTK